jgi:hypothetical protein
MELLGTQDNSLPGKKVKDCEARLADKMRCDIVAQLEIRLLAAL